MDRRAFLAAALATAAGCSETGESGSEPPTDTTARARTTTRNPAAPTPTESTPTASETPTDRSDRDTATPTPVPAPRVTDTRPQTALIYLTAPDSMGVAAPEHEQLLLLNVVAGDRVGRYRLRVRANGGSFEPAMELLQRQWLVDGETNDRYGADHAGWVAFDLPVIVSANAALTVEGTDAATPLDDGVVERLADPPDFTVESVIREGTALRVRVRNDGGEGVFRAALNLSGTLYAAEPVSFRVGGDTTHERTVEVGYGDDATYTLLWPGGERTV